MLLFTVNIVAIGRVPRMGLESRSLSRHLAMSSKVVKKKKKNLPEVPQGYNYKVTIIGLCITRATYSIKNVTRPYQVSKDIGIELVMNLV